MGVYKRHTVEKYSDDDILDVKSEQATVLGAKKRRGESIKYQLHLSEEEKFKGMIWDIAFSPLPPGDIVITTTEEAKLCDKDLKLKRTLEHIMAPGGAGFLHNGQILVVCRSSDNVNLFSQNGTFRRSWQCGPSPCGLAVNSSDEVIVTDTGASLVRFYTPEGQLLRTIDPRKDNSSPYDLVWPIYVTLNAMDDVIISDCHQQKVLVFDENGQYKSRFSLVTQGGNKVRKYLYYHSKSNMSAKFYSSHILLIFKGLFRSNSQIKKFADVLNSPIKKK